MKIGSIIELKAEIIQIKKTLFEAHEEIAILARENHELKDEIEKMNTEDDDKNATGKYNISHFE